MPLEALFEFACHRLQLRMREGARKKKACAGSTVSGLQAQDIVRVSGIQTLRQKIIARHLRVQLRRPRGACGDCAIVASIESSQKVSQQQVEVPQARGIESLRLVVGDRVAHTAIVDTDNGEGRNISRSRIRRPSR